MNLIITALLLSFAYAPAGLRAQPGQPWTIESGPRSSQVNESVARGYAALPASVLVSVGAEVSYARDGVVVQVGAHQVAVANGAAQVTVDGTARPLANPVY
ncbi:MAG TPA: hypothetical protein VK420_22150, partial [Longimicrobium sp.]|nr:hypothetical protein [Longimicrobium sp.]